MSIEIETTIVYKIRDYRSGLFWRGGRWGGWSKAGRVYLKRGVAENTRKRAAGYYNDVTRPVQIVAFELRMTPIVEG